LLYTSLYHTWLYHPINATSLQYIKIRYYYRILNSTTLTAQQQSTDAENYNELSYTENPQLNFHILRFLYSKKGNQQSYRIIQINRWKTLNKKKKKLILIKSKKLALDRSDIQGHNRSTSTKQINVTNNKSNKHSTTSFKRSKKTAIAQTLDAQQQVQQPSNRLQLSRSTSTQEKFSKSQG